jgi:hypothetical protein
VRARRRFLTRARSNRASRTLALESHRRAAQDGNDDASDVIEGRHGVGHPLKYTWDLPWAGEKSRGRLRIVRPEASISGGFRRLQPERGGTIDALSAGMTLQSIIRFSLLTVTAPLLAGCAAMTVGSHIESAAGFSEYQTFAWGPRDALPTGDPRLDANIFFRDHVEGAIEKQLVKRGLRQVVSNPADLRVHYHANVRQRIDVEATDREYGCAAGTREPHVVEFEEGTLVVDVIDARTNRLVWRGWAQDSVNVDDSNRLHRQIDQAVPRMFMQFPLAMRQAVGPVEP